ncbi:MAG: cupin-like domain-containing protein [Deltaproteobacteria bacterium]|nr:cupin-like domain-containing protein [Deltaproteobacteria bacterium]
MPAFEANLASLIHPVSVEEFFSGYWGKKPLYVPRSNRGYYQTLFSTHDIHDILRFSAPLEGWNDKVKMAIKYRMVPQEVLFDRDAPGFNYRMIAKSVNAVSLVLNHIQDDSNRIFHLTKRLGQDLQGRISGQVNVNAYLSPGRSYIGCHRDTHDEFNIQVEGSKRWQVYEPDVRVPYFGMPMDSGLDPKTGRPAIYDKEPIMDIVLNQGEFLYMPRGFWHNPVNSDAESSLGLTIGVHPLCWLDVLILALKAEAAGCENFRETVPVGLALDSPAQAVIPDALLDLYGKMRDRISLPNIVSELPRETSKAGPRPEEIRFPSVEDLENLCFESKLRRLEAESWVVEQSYGFLKLRVGQREIGLRMELKPIMDYICESAMFTPVELPGDLSAEERIRLCRFLLNFGAIIFASRASAS